MTNDESRRPTLRLVNGRILDVPRGSHLPAGTAIDITDGRIAALPEPGTLAAGATALPIIDLGGRYVAPGLCNAHGHLQLVLPSLLLDAAGLWKARRLARRQIEKNMEDCILHGVTVARDAWSEDLRHGRRLRERIAAGEIPGPHLRQSVLVSQRGGTFAQERNVLDRALGALVGLPLVDYDDPASGVVAFPPDAEPRAVRDAVDRAIDERSADSIKLYDQREKKLTYEPGATLMTQPQLDAACDQARRRGVSSELHHVTVESFRRGVRAGVTALAHVPLDAPLAREDVHTFVAARCVLIPTLSLAYDLDWPAPGDHHRDPSRLQRLADFRDASFAALVRRFWLPELHDAALRGKERAETGRTKLFGLLELGRVFRYFSGVVSHGMDNVRAVVAAGGRLAVGNDCGPLPRTPAMVGLELALLDFALRKGGARLFPAEALRTATLHGAEALGIADRAGTIAPGKAADLAVYDRDPLADFGVLGSPVAALFQGGRLVVNRCGLSS